MSKNNQQKFAAFVRRKKMATTSLALIASASLLLSYQNGPAKNGSTVTGAPFNRGQTCAKCHNGGNFGGAITTQFLDVNNNPVSAYVPGQSYSLKIVMTKTSTKSAKYGFQTTAASAVAQSNINGWGTLPAGTHNQLKKSRNYVEHSAPLSSGTIVIPFTVPANATDTIVFWTAGNVVNNNGGTSGDQAINTFLKIPKAPAPIAAIKNYKGVVQNNNAVLSWQSANENNIREFIIEKSINGSIYKAAGTVHSTITGNYTFIDAAFSGTTTQYRIKVISTDETASYYGPLTLDAADKNNYSLSLYSHAGTSSIMFHNGGKAQKVQLLYTDINGKPIYSGITYANEGDNIWPIVKNKVQGIVVVNVITETGIKTSLKLAVNK